MLWLAKPAFKLNPFFGSATAVPVSKANSIAVFKSKFLIFMVIIPCVNKMKPLQAKVILQQ